VTGIPTEEFERLIGELRPKLHRYCARMTGSVVDGEDVVQDALIKALEARADAGLIENTEGWLFRIAHNAAVDCLRRRTRQAAQSQEIPEMIAATAKLEQDFDIAAASLRTFMRLPAQQRSAVILKDVLGHSLEEICEVMGGSVASAKSALQRGRSRLRVLAHEPEEAAEPKLAEGERNRLVQYVESFNARDFDSVRLMLADDVRLDLVNRFRAEGKDNVGEYLHRYALAEQWRFEAGLVDGRPAMFVFDRHDHTQWPAYFVVLDFAREIVVNIRDFLFARYALDGADLRLLSDHGVPEPLTR
jgi:RNA polymerase sigma-70 factor (ECF subfamily)